jgi:thymidylate synthase
MEPYLNLVREVYENASQKTDRTGTGTYSLFGRMMRFDLSKGFPLVTAKKVHFKSIVHELLWFLKGTDDTQYLEDHGVTIWREWQTYRERPDGSGVYSSIGPMYGVQWLSFPTPSGQTINQLDLVLDEIRRRPDSRRLVVSAWNPAFVPDSSLTPQENVIRGKGCLAPCHAFFQFYIQEGRLSCMLTQRSADLFLGVPFNIASYSLLTMMVAQQTGHEPGEFIWSGGDVHIYLNHLEQVKEMLSRSLRPLPELRINRKPPSIYDYKFEDFELLGYDPHPALRAPVAI